MSQIREVTASNIDDHWLEWLGRNQSFRYVPPTNAPITVRKEKSRRGDGNYWYGYRKAQGKLHKRYIGKAEDLTVNRLEEVAELLNIGTSPRHSPKVSSGSVTQSEEIARVLAENTRLQMELQICLAEGTCLTADLETVRLEKDKLQNELQIKLRNELQNELQTQNLPPDYQAVRDRILNKLKIGRQSASGKAIDCTFAHF